MTKKQALVVGALASLVSVSAWARTPVNPYSTDLNPMAVNRAVSIFLTPRGQRIFKYRLSDVLFRQGYSIDSGEVSSASWEADRPMRLDQLPVAMKKHESNLAVVRDLMQDWLKGFRLNDPRFHLQVDGIRYQLQFKHFGLEVDEELSRLYGSQEHRGVVLKLVAEVPALRLELDSIRARDLENSFLGQVGLDQFWAELGSEGPALKLEILVQLEITRDRQLRAQLVGVHSNLSDVPIQVGFDQPILLPEVKAIINGKTVTINQSRLEAELLRQVDVLKNALQDYLAQMAEDKGADYFNAMINERMPKGFREVNEMTPPGSGADPQAAKFLFSLKPSELRVSEGTFYLGLQGQFIDPTVHEPNRSEWNGRPTVLPRLDGESAPSRYDAAVGVSFSLVNRVIELSYQRGYFKKIPIGDDEFLELTRAPVLENIPGESSDRAAISIGARAWVKGAQTLVLSNPVDFWAKVIVRLKKQPDGAVGLEVESIDSKSVDFRKSALKIGFLEGAVAGVIAEKVKAVNKKFSEKPYELIKELPLPRQIMSMPIEIKGQSFDPNGHLVLFVELGGIKRGQRRRSQTPPVPTQVSRDKL